MPTENLVLLRSIWQVAAGYAVAVLATVLAITGRAALHPWLDNQCEFSLFYLSVIATAWIAGSGPAFFAIGLGTVSAAHFFIEPASSLYIEQIPDLVQLVIFVIVNVVATLLFQRLHRQRRLAESRSVENLRLSESLRLADERKDEFLALLAHELRNPLAPIRSSLAVLERNCICPDVVLRIRDVIQRQCDHLVRLTDDLMDISRFCRGKLSLQVETLDVRDAVYDAIELVDSAMRDKRHRFQVVLPSEPVQVQGDRVRLSQILGNLLGNAVKFTPTEGRITVDLEVDADNAVITVTDNGIGFSQTDSERIFNSFAQADGSRTREYGGLGLGLSIASRLAEMHGGSIETFSRGPGRGSRFSVNLPISDVLSSDSVNDPSALQKENSLFQDSETLDFDPPAAADLPPSKLLIIEDNEDASTLLKELFEAEGFTVKLASNGLEALQHALDDCPDVILLDIGLPGMDGFEIASRLRRMASLDQTRVIALTGWGSSVDRQHAYEAGFDLHLVKPVQFQDLLKTIQTVQRRAESSTQKNTPSVSMVT